VIQYRKFGRSYFDCDPLPGVIGGKLRGYLVVVGEIASLDQIQVKLQCRRTQTTRRGSEDHDGPETIWETSQTLTVPGTRFGEEELRLPVDILIPGSCLPTQRTKDEGQIVWNLLTRGSTSGVDLAVDFEVPIFRTKDSAPAIEEQQPSEPLEDAAADSQDPPQEARIRRTIDAHGNTVLIASAWPGFRFAGMVLIFVTIFSAISAVLGLGLWSGKWFLIPFLLMFGLLTLVMWAILLSLFGSRRVTLTEDHLEVRRTFGPFATRRLVPTSDLTLSFKDTASTGRRKWYAVFAQPTGGRKTCLAGMIEGRLGAKWYVRQIEEYLAARKRMRR
jgi:hypothetical protein